MFSIVFLVFAVGVLFLALGCYFDLKTGEIPEKVSMGFIFVVLSSAGLHSLYVWNTNFIANSLFVGLAYFVLGYVLFWLGQWGGGDVKLFTGIGLTLGYMNALGYAWPNATLLNYSISFIINMAFIASPYVVIYGLILGLSKPKVFWEFAANMRRGSVLAITVLSFAPALILMYYGIRAIGLLYLLLPPLIIATVYLKTVEYVILRKTVPVLDLKEGDIPAEDIVLDGKVVASKRCIEGLTLEQVREIKKLSASGEIQENITIKWGIKFVPILLFSLITTVLVGNLMEIMLRILVS